MSVEERLSAAPDRYSIEPLNSGLSSTSASCPEVARQAFCASRSRFLSRCVLMRCARRPLWGKRSGRSCAPQYSIRIVGPSTYPRLRSFRRILSTIGSFGPALSISNPTTGTLRDCSAHVGVTADVIPAASRLKIKRRFNEPPHLACRRVDSLMVSRTMLWVTIRSNGAGRADRRAAVDLPVL